MCEVFYQYNAGGLSYLAGRVFIPMGCISLNSHPIQFRHVKKHVNSFGFMFLQ